MELDEKTKELYERLKDKNPLKVFEEVWQELNIVKYEDTEKNHKLLNFRSCMGASIYFFKLMSEKKVLSGQKFSEYYEKLPNHCKSDLELINKAIEKYKIKILF
jgi:hypothetical protein